MPSGRNRLRQCLGPAKEGQLRRLPADDVLSSTTSPGVNDAAPLHVVGGLNPAAARKIAAATALPEDALGFGTRLSTARTLERTSSRDIRCNISFFTVASSFPSAAATANAMR